MPGRSSTDRVTRQKKPANENNSSSEILTKKKTLATPDNGSKQTLKKTAKGKINSVGAKDVSKGSTDGRKATTQVAILEDDDYLEIEVAGQRTEFCSEDEVENPMERNSNGPKEQQINCLFKDDDNNAIIGGASSQRSNRANKQSEVEPNQVQRVQVQEVQGRDMEASDVNKDIPADDW